MLRDLIPLAVVALLLLSARADLGFGGLLAWYVVLAALIFSLYVRVRLAATRVVAASIARPGTWARLLIEHRLMTYGIGLLVAALGALHLLVFLALVPPVFLLFVALDALLVLWLGHVLSGSFEAQLQPGAAAVGRELALLIVNVLALLTCLISVEALTDHHDQLPTFSPDIPLLIVDEVRHSCLWWQHLLRTAAFLDLNVRSLQALPHVGPVLYWTVYVVTLSIIPLTAITCCYRAAARLPLRLTFSRELRA